MSFPPVPTNMGQDGRSSGIEGPRDILLASLLGGYPRHTALGGQEVKDLSTGDMVHGLTRWCDNYVISSYPSNALYILEFCTLYFR